MNIPSGLRHIMEVYRVVNKTDYSYTGAFKIVATKARITEASVRSACTRDIGINTTELDLFLDPLNAEAFKNHLFKRYPSQTQFIDRFINDVLGKNENELDDTTRTLRSLFDDEKENILSKIRLLKMLEQCSEWISRDDVPDDIKVKMQEWLNK